MAQPHDSLLAEIEAVKGSPNRFAAIVGWVTNLDKAATKALLEQSGFIPEGYEHDSSEEKLYAKAMDALVARALTSDGYETRVETQRGDIADVTAQCRRPREHTVVLDAKAFRLSRSALNPKDYKIEALSTWRREADFACLVGPLAGFPSDDSRLFAEALRFGITLLTFSHLQFSLEHGIPKPDALIPVWAASAAIAAAIGNRPNATDYWRELDKIFCGAVGVPVQLFSASRHRYIASIAATADAEIAFYEGEKQRIRTLPRAELVTRLISALKIDGRIGVIRVKKAKSQALLAEVERAERVVQE